MWVVVDFKSGQLGTAMWCGVLPCWLISQQLSDGSPEDDAVVPLSMLLRVEK